MIKADIQKVKCIQLARSLANQRYLDIELELALRQDKGAVLKVIKGTYL